MSLLVTSLFVVGGVLVGRWIARGGKPVEPALPAATGQPALASAPGEAKRVENGSRPIGKKEHDWSPFPCALGDVVARAGGGEERWLAGALVLSEERPVAVLFVAPEAGGDRAVYARPRPNGELAWLEPVARDAIASFQEPPTSLEVNGVRYERLRRLPLRAERVGAGAPDVGDAVILAEYTAAGAERLVLIVGGGAARAWRGPALDPSMYDVMPSGKATLEGW